jgi:hypothetical protein
VQRARPIALAGTSDALEALNVSSGLLSTFGVRPYAGRAFTAAEDEAPSDSVMVSYETWQTRFGGDPAIVGRRTTIEEVTRTIVGVLPRSSSLKAIRRSSYCQWVCCRATQTISSFEWLRGWRLASRWTRRRAG